MESALGVRLRQLTFFIGIIVSCISTTSCERKKEETSEMSNECEFAKVRLYDEGPNPCSPIPPTDSTWRGLLINAPKQVEFTPGQSFGPTGAFAAIPICSYSHFDVLPEPTLERPLLVAKEIETKQTYTGAIRDIDPNSTCPAARCGTRLRIGPKRSFRSRVLQPESR